jgi:transposase
MKAVPGRKSDVQDAEWIAELLRHGLLRSSFIPSREQRDLRELTRHRSSLAGKRAQAANELQKSLERANIKLQSVDLPHAGFGISELRTGRRLSVARRRGRLLLQQVNREVPA